MEIPPEQPVRGVIHAAGVLADSTIDNMTPARFRHVLHGKALGAFNLHCALRNVKLDFFVLYSSIAVHLGSPGQSNYVAANAFLDSLAHYRHAKGLPATTINWGAFAEAGMAAAPEVRARLARAVPPMSQALGSRLLLRALRQSQPQLTLAKLQLSALAESFPQLSRWSFLQELMSEAPKTSTPLSSMRAEVLAAPGEARTALLNKILREHLQVVLRISEEKLKAVADETRLVRLGLDSLLALELRSRLESALGVTLSLGSLLGDLSLGGASQLLAERFSGVDPHENSSADYDEGSI